jgi:osmotically-inducible protein OsmY
MNSRYTWAAMLGLGAGVMFLFDPQGGNRRRALLRDKLRRFSRITGERTSAWSEMAADHARGFVAETSARLRHEEVDDYTLVERVRAELGRVLTHVSAVNVEARDGCVILRGDVLEHEAEAALAAARTTRGVRSVEDALERHAEPGNVPSLQGGESSHRFPQR